MQTEKKGEQERISVPASKPDRDRVLCTGSISGCGQKILFESCGNRFCRFGELPAGAWKRGIPAGGRQYPAVYGSLSSGTAFAVFISGGSYLQNESFSEMDENRVSSSNGSSCGIGGSVFSDGI